MASRIPIGALVVVLASLLGSGACDACDGSHPSGSTITEPPQPPERPAATRVELHFRGGTPFLGALREQIGGGLTAAAFPRTPGDLLGRLVELPESLQARVLPDSHVEGILLGETADPHRVFAARLTLEQDAAHPLGPEFALGEPVAGDYAVDAHWVGTGSEPAMALAADTLVVGDTPEAVRTALPWLVMDAMVPEGPPALTISLRPGVVSRSVHAIVSAALDRWVRDARDDLAAERARHDAAPQMADPEAALNLMEQKARALVALLPDVGELTLTLTNEAAGPTLDMRMAVTPGSPLAGTLASLHPFATTRLARMPVTAALRLLVASASPDPDDGEGSTLGALLGDRLSPEQRHALDAIGAALHDGSGPRGFASGTREGRPFVVYFDRSGADIDVGAQLRTAMGSNWLKQTLGLALGCEGGPPRLSPERGALCLGSCAGDATRDLTLARSEQTSVLLLQPSEEEDQGAAMAQQMVETYASEGRVPLLDPARQRILGALPAESLLAALIDPTRLLPSAVALMHPGAPLPEVLSPPIGLGISVEADALHAKLILAPGAASNFANVGLGFLRASVPPYAGSDPDRALRDRAP